MVYSAYYQEHTLEYIFCLYILHVILQNILHAFQIDLYADYAYTYLLHVVHIFIIFLCIFVHCIQLHIMHIFYIFAHAICLLFCIFCICKICIEHVFHPTFVHHFVYWIHTNLHTMHVL